MTIGRSFPVEEVRNAVRPGAAAADKLFYMLEREGSVVGMLDIIRNYPEPQTGHLGFIFLAKSIGGGQGRRCPQALYPGLRAQGAIALRLGVVETNERARRLYVTEGFEHIATREVDPSVKRLPRTLVLQRPL